MNETKMLSFEEWYKPEGDNSLEDCWNAARQGMIPAENAIVVPAVWPEWAVMAKGAFYGETGPITKTEPFGIKIPRPTPAWTPKIGEAVFFLGEDGMVCIDKISNISVSGRGPIDWGFYTNLMPGDSDCFLLADIKPFSESAIGKKWEDI